MPEMREYTVTETRTTKVVIGVPYATKDDPIPESPFVVAYKAAVGQSDWSVTHADVVDDRVGARGGEG